MVEVLSYKDESAMVAPEFGGVLLSYESQGQPILRPSDDGGGDPERSAHFPLIPFANRIRHGQFEFQGRKVKLEKNDENRNALHGFGWRTPWYVVERSRHSIRIRHDYTNGPWPWAYQAEQAISLSDEGLRIEMSLCNKSPSPMPAGLGFHPYFPNPQNARLRAAIANMHVINPETLKWQEEANHPAATAVRNGDALPQGLDNYFGGWEGPADLFWPTHRVEMTASKNLSFLALYSPKHEDFFCLEPVSHPVNHFDEQGLTSGEKLAAWVALKVHLK